MAGKIIDEDVLKLTVQNLTQLIADHVYEEIPYQDSEIDNMFDATTQEIDYYSSLISDTLVSENRIFSSKHVSDLIQQAVLDSNAYSDDLIKNISSIQLEWCETSLPTTGETNKIYILPVTSGSDTVNTLNIWNATTSAYVSIGNLEIDLSQYYTSSQVDTKLADKANSSEVLAVNKVQTATGSETNDTVYSSKLTKTELDKKANDDEVVKKTDIVTSINSSSADDKVPSAKAVFTPIDKIQSSLTSLTPVLDLNNFKRKTFMIGRGTGYNNECANVPNGVTGAFVVEYFPYDDGELYGVQRLTLVQAFGGKYITFERSLDNGNWMGWQKVCTTSVADVGKTNINTTNANLTKTGECCYLVENGICYVSLWGIKSSALNKQIVSADLPNPKIKVGSSMSYDDTTSNMGNYGGYMYINKGGTLCIDIQKTNFSLFGAFSYPVAES